MYFFCVFLNDRQSLIVQLENGEKIILTNSILRSVLCDCVKVKTLQNHFMLQWHFEGFWNCNWLKKKIESESFWSVLKSPLNKNNYALRFLKTIHQLYLKHENFPETFFLITWRLFHPSAVHLWSSLSPSMKWCHLPQNNCFLPRWLYCCFCSPYFSLPTYFLPGLSSI